MYTGLQYIKNFLKKGTFFRQIIYVSKEFRLFKVSEFQHKSWMRTVQQNWRFGNFAKSKTTFRKSESNLVCLGGLETGEDCPAPPHHRVHAHLPWVNQHLHPALHLYTF
jgi:hypothetical protein